MCLSCIVIISVAFLMNEYMEVVLSDSLLVCVVDITVMTTRKSLSHFFSTIIIFYRPDSKPKKEFNKLNKAAQEQHEEKLKHRG